MSRTRMLIGGAALLVLLGGGLLFWQLYPGDRLVTLVRSGGLAGGTVSVVVREDGRLSVERRKGGDLGGRLPADELVALRRELENADFAHLPAKRMGPGNDLYVYSVHYQGHEVTTNDAGAVPTLAPVLRRLEGLIHRYNG